MVQNTTKKCSAEGCTNYARKGGVCVSHGAICISYSCKRRDCSSNVNQKGGFCFRHASKEQCSFEGCDNIARIRGYCRRHRKEKIRSTNDNGSSSEPQPSSGDKEVKKNARPSCSVDGCNNNAAGGGICIKHGGKQICSVEGCNNQVKKRGVCISHGAKRKRCSVEGCNKQVVEGGVCVLHGAKLKKCKRRGCSTNATKGGLCCSHSPKEQCSYEGCDNIAQTRGYCRRHRREQICLNDNVSSSESQPSSENKEVEETVGDGPQKKNACPSCSVDGCNNNAAGGGICTKHGGKRIRKKCSVEGCTKRAQSGGKACISHGGIRRSCSVEGCNSQAKKGGVCVVHKEVPIMCRPVKRKRKICSVEGCTNHSRSRGVCSSHGAKRKICSVEGCNQYGREGGVCVSHGAKYNKCSFKGCNNHVVEGGVCVSHGAKREKCKSRGCSTIARRGGFCFSHAPKKQCLVEGCDNIAAVRGCCEKHAKNCNIYSKKNDNSTTNDVDSDHQPQHSEQVGPSVCLPVVKRVNKNSNHCVTQDQAVMNREEYTTYYESESKRTHSNENQVCKNQTTVSSANLDSDEEEELGALIYKSSQTAKKMRAEANSAKMK